MIWAGRLPVGSDPIRANAPLRQAYSETALSVASTLASTGPWFVSTATMSREGFSGLIVMGGSKVPGSCGCSSPPEDVSGPIDHKGIGDAVAGQVGQNGRGIGSGDGRSGRGEGAVAIAQKHRDCARVGVG